MEKTEYLDKIILVTGGVGSIGSEIVRKLLSLKPKAVIALDNNETGLFDLQQECNSPLLRIKIGDVRDKDAMVIAMTGVDIVFHAAALKHVPLCEYNPYEAVKSNILGTQNVLDAAIVNCVKKVIIISTDKAVNPINTMGASKYLAERLTISANCHPKNDCTAFSVVRFGNVLNSRGSIIPIFYQQLSKKQPLTITDLEMTRFVMTIPEAVSLVLTAGSIAKGMEIFILKMPTLRIVDLARVMRSYLASRFGYLPDEIQIKNIGIRVGEKLSEDLMTVQESAFAYENEHMFIVYPPDAYLQNIDKKYDIPAGFTKCTASGYSSQSTKCILDDEIVNYLKKVEL